jgi:hypothetical protein
VDLSQAHALNKFLIYRVGQMYSKQLEEQPLKCVQSTNVLSAWQELESYQLFESSFSSLSTRLEDLESKTIQLFAEIFHSNCIELSEGDLKHIPTRDDEKKSNLYISGLGFKAGLACAVVSLRDYLVDTSVT